MIAASTTRTIAMTDGLTLTVDEYGDTADSNAVLMLHGGAGPHTMTGLATALSEHVRVIAPTHPGFDGTARPEWCDSVADLAETYLDLLTTLDLTDVMVVGNSVGGWIAAEMALRDTDNRIGALALVNALGVHPEQADDLVDTRTISVAKLGLLAFHDPSRRLSPSDPDDRQRATMAANGRAVAIYGGESYTHDPKLRGRLHRVTVPVLVAWGEQDGLASVKYGRGYADAFPDGHFTPIPDAGHFPQIEQPDRTLGAIGDFASTVVRPAAAAPTSTSRTVDLSDGLALTIAEHGDPTNEAAVLVLHGGAGPRTVTGLAAALSQHVRAIVPTHPGFDGTPRPQWCDSVGDLADVYLELLDTLDLTGVMVIGNSVGGWIAAEMAARDTQGRIGALNLINALGIAPDNNTDIVDIRTVRPTEIGALSFADPAFAPDFATFSDQQKATMAANQQTLAGYAGATFTHDPKLHRRLRRVTIPVLVTWGEQDGIATAAYGHTYADAFPNGHHTPIPDAGHLPQVEQLGSTLAAIGDFVDTVVKPPMAS
jgi:pimeloyl-ACP methyl ester carboxylesterase